MVKLDHVLKPFPPDPRRATSTTIELCVGNGPQGC